MKLVVKSDNVGKYGDKYFFRVNPVYKRKNMDIRLIEISSDKPALCIPEKIIIVIFIFQLDYMTKIIIIYYYLLIKIQQMSLISNFQNYLKSI